jgi:hypothetical protein
MEATLKGPLVDFKPTVTLGNVLAFIAWCVLAIAGWTHMKDQQDYMQVEISDMRQVQARMLDALSAQEQISATQTALIQSLHDRMQLDESYTEKRQ